MTKPRAATAAHLGAQAPTFERPWSHADVLTMTECALRLGGRREDVERWLRRAGLVAVLDWGERVVWGSVLHALDPTAARPTPSGGRKVTATAPPLR